MEFGWLINRRWTFIASTIADIITVIRNVPTITITRTISITGSISTESLQALGTDGTLPHYPVSRTLRLTSPSRECRFKNSSDSNFSRWLGTTRGILKRNLGLGGCSACCWG